MGTNYYVQRSTELLEEADADQESTDVDLPYWHIGKFSARAEGLTFSWDMGPIRYAQLREIYITWLLSGETDKKCPVVCEDEYGEPLGLIALERKIGEARQVFDLVGRCFS